MLSGVLHVLLWLLLICLGGLALLLALPFAVQASGVARDEEYGWQARLSWGWGLVAVHADQTMRAYLSLFWMRIPWGISLKDESLSEEEKRQRAAEKKRKKAEKKARKKARKQLKRQKKKDAGKPERGNTWLLRHLDFLLRSVRALVGTFGIHLQIEGCLGTGDPVDSQVLVAGLNSLGRLPGVEAAVQTDYLDERMDGRVELGGRLWLPLLVIVALWMLCQGDGRRLLRHALVH